MKSLLLAVLLTAATPSFAQQPGCLQSDESKLTKHDCYLNRDLLPTHCPSTTTQPNVQPPVDASAMCADGTYSFSRHSSGTCSHHGGVNQRYR
jgi:hypothetical protein